MVKNEEVTILVKEKFRLCENYLNDIEMMVTALEGTPSSETINTAKIAMLAGKLSVQISDIQMLLEIHGSVEEMYKEVNA